MGKIIGEGITFDDVLLVPAYSEVIPNQVDLTTYLTKTIKLNIPMMSAGMEAAAGNRMKTILEKLTSNRFLGIADDECRYGYRYRASDGDRYGASGRNWYHPQEHDH